MNENEIQINFRDYFFYTIRRWRKILLSAAVFAVCIWILFIIKSVLSWDKNVKKFDDEIAQYNIDNAVYEDNKTAFELELMNIKSKLDSQEEYVANSVLLKLDANNVLETKTVLLLVKDNNISDNGSKYNAFVNSLLKIYADNLYNLADWKDISEFLNVDEEYAKELVKVEVDYDSYTIDIIVLYPDAGYSKAIIDKILNNSDISNLEIFKGYDILILNQTSGYIKDEELAEYITEENEIFSTLKNDYERGLKDTEELERPEYPNNKKLSKKYIVCISIIIFIIAFGVMLFVMFVIYYYKFTRKGIIYSANEFERIFGVTNIGIFSKNTPKKMFVDKFIDKKDSEKKEIDEKQEIERIKININNFSDDIKSILIVGKDTEKVNGVFSNIKKQITNKKFNICYDVKDIKILKQLKEVDAVIFISERENTDIFDLNSYKKFAYENNMEIIGNIVV